MQFLVFVFLQNSTYPRTNKLLPILLFSSWLYTSQHMLPILLGIRARNFFNIFASIFCLIKKICSKIFFNLAGIFLISEDCCGFCEYFTDNLSASKISENWIFTHLWGNMSGWLKLSTACWGNFNLILWSFQ